MLSKADVIHRLDHALPATRDGQLGTTLDNLITAHNDLVAKHAALLAHLDTANVAGIGNANAATYGTAITSKLTDLGTRRIS